MTWDGIGHYFARGFKITFMVLTILVILHYTIICLMLNIIYNNILRIKYNVRLGHTCIEYFGICFGLFLHHVMWLQQEKNDLGRDIQSLGGLWDYQKSKLME